MRQQARTAFRFLPPAVAAALTFSLVIWLTEQGPGLSPDSAYYLSAAENLLSGSGLTTFEGRPLTTWPPLFPVLIAGLGSVGVSPAEAARVINAAAAGLAVLVFGLLADRLLRRPELRLLALVGIISVPLLSVALMAWTEAVFVLLCLLFVLLFASWLDTGKTLVLAAAASCTALAALQRWAGLALIPAGILLVLTAAGPVSRLRRAGLTLLFAVIGLGPPAAWMVRNLAVAGTLAGRRPFTSGSLPAALRELGTVVGEYLLPDFLLTDWSWLPVLAVVALFVFWRLRRTWQAPGPAAHFERVLGLTTAAYVAGVALVLTPHALEQVARLLVPAWPLLLLLMLAALQQVAEDIGRRVGRPTVIRALAALLAAVWLLHPVVRLAVGIDHWRTEGIGVYDLPVWQNLKIVAWLRNNPHPRPVLSNDPAAVWLLAGQEARMSLRQDLPLEQQLAEHAVRPGDRLVWFLAVKREYLLGVAELSSVFELEELVYTGDGGVLEFR